jgi:hypothetical protein
VDDFNGLAIAREPIARELVAVALLVAIDMFVEDIVGVVEVFFGLVLASRDSIGIEKILVAAC